MDGKPAPAQILVIEDDKSISSMLQDLLTEEGYLVKVVGDGREAVQLLAEVSPDLVLLDLNLPGLSGHGILEEIRKRDLEYNLFIPVIILTGVYTSRNDKVLCLNSGADDFLPKPFDMIELLARVRSLLRLRDMHKRSQYLATHDHLTRCYNRRYLMEFVDHQLARLKRYKVPFSVMLLDLDHFKKVNDSYGHDKGDQVLVHLGFRLQDFFRAVDCLARLGGDEFVAVLPECNLENAEKVGQRLMQFVRNSQFMEGLPPELSGKVNVSIGAACAPDHTSDREELFRLADKALYTSKKAGRNRFTMFKV